jgi:hypothetical protein
MMVEEVIDVSHYSAEEREIIAIIKESGNPLTFWRIEHSLLQARSVYGPSFGRPENGPH